MSPSVVHVLREDPALAVALSPDDFAIAARHLVAAEQAVPAGPWEPEGPLGRTPGDLGLLVLEGLVLRRTHVGRHTTAELLGAGDLLRPWEHEPLTGSPDASAEWRVLQPLRVAVLDARFATLAGRLPVITAELVARTTRRSRLLGVLLAISSMPRLDERLLALLWHLADRWGSVGPDGTLVPLELTHATLAELTGAQRPSVTSALRALLEQGLLHRVPEGWLLTGEPYVVAPPRGADASLA